MLQESERVHAIYIVNNVDCKNAKSQIVNNSKIS